MYNIYKRSYDQVIPNNNNNNNNLENFEELKGLSEKERELALQILQEFSSQGTSKKYNELKYRDYKEIPVDIETFLTDDNYLGKAWKDATGKSKLYPFWLEQLKKLFPTNVDTDYNTFLESGARGIGKSEVACGCVCTYLMYRVMCMKNPNAFFHLKQTEKICFAFMNIKLALAEEIAASKFQKTVQMSSWFMSKGTMTTKNNQPWWDPPEPIHIIIGSQSDDVIGLPIFFCFFDEISFIRNQDIDKQKKKAKDMIDTAIGGMFTRFIYGGKNPTVLAVASSKRSEQSFMEEYIKQLSKTNPDKTLVIDKPVWEVKPKGTYSDEIFYVGLGNKFLESIVIPDEDRDNLDFYKQRGYQILKVPIDFRAKFLEDIERNLCDFAGISSSSMNKYMSGAVVSDCINEDYKNPFPDIIEVGNGPEDTAQYQNFFKIEYVPQELLSKPLYIHLDMSISGDMTGIAGVWISGKKVNQGGDQSKDLNFRLAFSTSIKAPKGRQISFEKNRNFIRWLKSIGFKIKHITSDTYQSYDLQQQLTAEGFECSILSVDRVDNDSICKPYQYLRSTIYERRFSMYKSNRLFDEFIDIQRDMNTGKIDHSPNFHKDVLDAVCGATFTASKYAEQYAFDYGEDLETVTKVSGSIDQGQEISQAFQEELMKMFDPMWRQQQQQKQNSLPNSQNMQQQQKQTNMDFGMGPAKPLPSNYINQGIIVF